jgi:hypothetical protein
MALLNHLTACSIIFCDESHNSVLQMSRLHSEYCVFSSPTISSPSRERDSYQVAIHVDNCHGSRNIGVG